MNYFLRSPLCHQNLPKDVPSILDKDLANIHPEVADWASVEVENVPHSSVPFSLEFEVDFWEKYLTFKNY